MLPNRLIRRTSLCALTLGVIYTLACTYLWARQGHFIFEPRREIKKTPAIHRLSYEDIYVTISDGSGAPERIHGWWIPADPREAKVLLYLHGSALNIGANVDAARRFNELGYSVFLISYRGYGLSDGKFPTEEQVYADAEAAWNYLVKPKGITSKHIFIYGHSIGGAVAIDLALRHPEAAGLIVESSFTSIIDVARLNNKFRFFPLDLIVEQKFDSLEKVVHLKVPVLFIHGTEDCLIPPEMSRRLYELTSSPKRLKFINGAAHNNSGTVGGEDYVRTIIEFEVFARQNL